MYEIWDLVSGNLVEEFDTEAEALKWIYLVLKDEGQASVEGLALLGPDGAGQRLLAEGSELARQAKARVSAA